MYIIKIINKNVGAFQVIHNMNSYGSVALVSQSIYKLLRYMNWFSNDDATDDLDANYPPSQNKPP
jgi:hypothetical protein